MKYDWLTPEAKKDIITWIAALRSGKYKQTTGRLQNVYGYCCLGVACELFSPKHEKDKENYLIGGLPLKEYNDPEWLIKMATISFNSNYLQSLNDFDKLSFSKIADVIETWLKEQS